MLQTSPSTYLKLKMALNNEISTRQERTKLCDGDSIWGFWQSNLSLKKHFQSLIQTLNSNCETHHKKEATIFPIRRIYFSYFLAFSNQSGRKIVVVGPTKFSIGFGFFCDMFKLTSLLCPFPALVGISLFGSIQGMSRLSAKKKIK